MAVILWPFLLSIYFQINFPTTAYSDLIFIIFYVFMTFKTFLEYFNSAPVMNMPSAL